jgi:general secretion pathway protein B
LRKAKLPPVRPVVEPVAEPSPERSYVSQLPVWPRIPANLFEQINASLRLDVHVYSDDPQERFVLINLQKYFEGQELQEGPRLDEITPDGAVLSFRGQRFRVPAK